MPMVIGTTRDENGLLNVIPNAAQRSEESRTYAFREYGRP
jgi:hypothetical protein